MDNTGSLLLQGKGGNTSFGYTFSVNGSDFSYKTSISSLVAGTYSIVAKDANQCISGDFTITLTEPSGKFIMISLGFLD